MRWGAGIISVLILMNVKHSSISVVFGAVLCLVFGNLGFSQQSGMNYSHFDHVLKSYVDGHGYVPRNASYKIKYIDYDWRLNEKENE
jgi:hypothetical protein